jgi:predicted DCC family thiol-disulfide oxidoreductase YuxK
MMIQKPFVIYDPKCALCLRVKKILLVLDRSQSLDFVSLYQLERLQQIPNLNLEECHGKVHFVNAKQEIFQGSVAVQEILSLITPESARPVVDKILAVSLVQRSLATGYDLLNSYRLKKRGSCEVCH